MDPATLDQLFERFESGADAVKAALAKLPPEAVRWRPGENKWSAQEVVWHCADAELCTASRIRYLVCDTAPLIPWYDESAWARKLNYNDLPLEAALTLMTAVRENSSLLIRTLPADAWTAQGWHTAEGLFTGENWLRYYSEHLHMHANQIERNLLAWQERPLG